MRGVPESLDARRWDRLREIYGAARSMDPAERTAFLAQACGGDEALREELESLLAQPTGDSFLESPAWGKPEPRAEPAPPSTWRHPFFWFVLAVAVPLSGLFGYAAWHLGGPEAYFGWSEKRYRGQVFVEKVDTGGPAAGVLRPGDMLLSLDGDRNAASGGTHAYRRALKPGVQYEAAVRREGEPLRLLLSVGQRRPRMLSRLTYWIIGFVWCGIGVFFGLARPQDAVARLAFLSSTMTGYSFLAVGNLPYWNYVGSLHAVVGFHFFYRFPGGKGAGGGWRILLGLTYAIGAYAVAERAWKAWLLRTEGPAGLTSWLAGGHLLAGAWLPGSAWDVAGDGSTALPTLGYLAWLAALGLSMAGAVGCAVSRYRRLTDPGLKMRFHWVAAGGVLGLSLPLLWTAMAALRLAPGLAPALAEERVWIDISLAANASSIAAPLCVAYAVLRYQVFDVAVVIRKGLQYLLAKAVLQGLLILPVAGLSYTLFVYRHRTVAELFGAASTEVYWIVLLVLALHYRRRLLGWLDRRFFREQYRAELLLAELVERFTACDSAAQVNTVLERELDSALHPKSLWIWSLERDQLRLEHCSPPEARPERCPLRAELVEKLGRQSGSFVVPLPESSGLLPGEARWLRERGVRVLLPLAGASRVHGVVMLGEKKSESPYSESDLRLLRVAAGQAALVRDNLSLHERVADEQRVRRDVLARVERGTGPVLRECPVCGACYNSGAERCERDGAELTLTLPVPRVVEGRYRLERLIGRGGMGAVYEARDLRLSRSVAVKLLLGGAFGNELSVRRFHREARIVASLRHPNVVEVYDFGELEGGGAFVVMELLRGRTLRAELKDAGRMAPAEAARWLDPALAGLGAAHEHGLVHRDFKPENILGEPRQAGALEVKVLDFGLAKPLPAGGAGDSLSITRTGFVVGTLAYMAPEQMAGKEVDRRADVYSAGVVIYEALTGRRPFEGEMLRREAPDWRDFPASPPRLREIVIRCLDREPQARYATAGELRSVLVPALLE